MFIHGRYEFDCSTLRVQEAEAAAAWGVFISSTSFSTVGLGAQLEQAESELTHTRQGRGRSPLLPAPHLQPQPTGFPSPSPRSLQPIEPRSRR